MDSSASTYPTHSRMMPYLAILQYEIQTLYKSRLVRLWAIAAGVLTLILTTSNWSNFQTAPMIASLLVPFLVFPWFVIVMVLGVAPLSGAHAETLAQSILCRPVTRYEYLLAAWSARAAVVLGIYLVVIVPAVLLITFAKRPVAADTVTLYGIASSLAVVGLVLLFQLSLGFVMGTLLRKSLLAVVILIFVWAPVNYVLNLFSLEEFSPISLNQAIPIQLRQGWRASSDEVKNGTPKPAATEPEKKTDTPGFFALGEFEDFSLGRVIAGYGLLTLFTVALSLLCFGQRDL